MDNFNSIFSSSELIYSSFNKINKFSSAAKVTCTYFEVNK